MRAAALITVPMTVIATVGIVTLLTVPQATLTIAPINVHLGNILTRAVVVTKVPHAVTDAVVTIAQVVAHVTHDKDTEAVRVAVAAE